MSFYLSFTEVLSFGISEKYLKFAIHKYRDSTGSWKNKPDNADGRKVLIDIDSIPKRTREKYSIPTGIEYFEQQLEREEKERKETLRKDRERRENKDISALLFAYKNNWHEHYSFYMDLFENRAPEKQKELAKLHAQNLSYWLEMVSLTGGKYKIHGSLTVAFQYHLELKKEIQFIAGFEEYNRFSTFLGSIRNAVKHEKDIEMSIVHKSTNQIRKKNTTDFHDMVLLELLAHPKRYSYPKVVDLMNHVCEQNGYKTISESWVKHQMSSANLEFRNLVMSTRAGESYFKSNFQKYAVRENTSLPGDIWMIDGSPIQFWCNSVNGKKFMRLNLFVVIDVSTRKIVGFDIAYSEDKYNIMRALQMAVEREGHLPTEIVSDHFSANKTEEIKHLKNLFEEIGCRWRHSKIGNPQDKVYVERFYGVFQSVFCALYDDYLGKGIGARDLSGNPSREFLQEVVKKEGSLNEAQMKQRITFLIGLYNQTPRKGINAPNDAYKLEKPNVSELNFGKSALIFWTATKNTIRNSMVKLKVKNKVYTFDVYGTQNKLALNGKTVRIRYDESQMESVAVFDYHTDRFLCECKATVKIVTGAINRTEDDDLNIYKHSAVNKAFENDLKAIKAEIVDKGLENAGLKELRLPHPLELSKNQINSQESMSLINYYSQINGLEPQYKEVVREPLKMLKHSNTVGYDESVKTKTKKKKDLKIVPVNKNISSN